MDHSSPETTAAHAGGRFDPTTGAVMPAIHPSTTYARGEDYDLIGSHGYSRDGHPVADQVEDVAAELDGGADALAFGSGMAAAVSFFETVDTGRHVVAPRVMYHGVQNWLRRLAERRGIGLTLFDQSEPDALAAAIDPGRTDVVWVETPVNPTWDVIDIAAAAAAAHAAGAALVVDSTVAPPVTTRPLDLGADFVFHSASKYYNGHSDVLAGLLIARAMDDRWVDVGQVRTAIGGILPPFEGWLLLRGLR
ncbi:MAG: aminotransferase class V-fold PLP-dependent enzyme, partial [Acidimicrobiia bacterium]|nr:aminotransferase class V-fold PLP-dependent enzyme [Acidimicrobiia bacterium]